MSLISVIAILLLTLFVHETNQLGIQRWWLSYLPPSHLKFYEPAALSLSSNKTFNGVFVNKNIEATTIKLQTMNVATAKTKAEMSKTTTSTATNTAVTGLAETLIASASGYSTSTAYPSNVINTTANAPRSQAGNSYVFNYYVYSNGSSNSKLVPTAENSSTKTSGQNHYDILPDCSSVNESGVYLIRVSLYSERPFMVYCEVIDNKPGWIVIQQRDYVEPKTDFNRDWADYRAGFGTIDGNYWLGLEKIWAITHSTLQELSIIMMNFKNKFRWYRYTVFSIGEEEQSYALESLGSGIGNAGDGLRLAEGQKFNTYDRDNEGGCAKIMKAGWWYKECVVGNLNSPFSKQWAAHNGSAGWPTPQMDQPLSFVKMMLRSRKYAKNKIK